MENILRYWGHIIEYGETIFPINTVEMNSKNILSDGIGTAPSM